MKKVSLILSIVSIVAVATLFVLFFISKSDKAEATDETEVTGGVAQKGDIVYIQLDTLVNQYDMFNDLKSELEGKATTIQNDLNKKGRAFENDAKSFDDQVKKGLLTRSQAEAMQNDLLTRQQNLQNYQQQKQMEMAEEESVMYNKVMESIKQYLKVYNQTKGYSLILTTSANSVVLEGNPVLDITQDVLVGLNEKYVKERNVKQ